jgi:Matrixin
MVRRWLFTTLGLVALVSLVGVAAAQPSPPSAVEALRAVPVEGAKLPGGKKLWVHVYYARDGKGRGKPTPAPSCPSDVNTQSQYLLFGKAATGGLTLKLNASSAPSAAGVGLARGISAWNGVRADYFTLVSSGGTSTPVEDNTSSIGWARFAQRNVLAATWTWTDANGRIDEADVFFNTRYTWANLDQCGGSSFDLGDIAAHELGHAVGLDHVSDADKLATMYPSAPAGEILKRTLTQGDASGFLAALQ